MRVPLPRCLLSRHHLGCASRSVHTNRGGNTKRRVDAMSAVQPEMQSLFSSARSPHLLVPSMACGDNWHCLGRSSSLLDSKSSLSTEVYD